MRPDSRVGADDGPWGRGPLCDKAKNLRQRRLHRHLLIWPVYEHRGVFKVQVDVHNALFDSTTGLEL